MTILIKITILNKDLYIPFFFALYSIHNCISEQLSFAILEHKENLGSKMR